MSIPLPKITGEVSYENLKKILNEKLSSRRWFFKSSPILYLVDRKYQLVAKSEMERFLKDDKGDLIQYVSEWHDCDDFSFRLMGQVSIPGWSGIAFGIACSNVHAFNLFYDGKDVWIIEPQTDVMWKVNEVPKKYKKYFLPVRFVMM